MTRLLFINPAIRESDLPRHVPYGELLLAACAEHWYNTDTALFDINALRSQITEKELREDLAAAIQEETWDLIGIGGITTTYSSIKQTLRTIRPLTDSLIVIGGGLLTAQPYEVMTWLPEADVGVIGEAVITLGEIIHHRNDRNFTEVPGVIWRQDGKLVLNRKRSLVEDLDILPLPKYDLAPLEIYFKNSSILLSEESMTAKRRLDYVASIGCSLSCNFCFDLGLTGYLAREGEVIFPRSHPEQVPRLNRWRSPEVCVQDWKFIRDKYGCDFISLLDENLCTMNAVHPTRDWIERISELCIKEGLQPQCVKDGIPHDPNRCDGLHFGGTAHASLITPKMLQAMKQMGFSYLDYGYEAWDDRILKYIKKGATVKTNIQSLTMTMQHGIRPIPNNQVGFEIEDFQSIRRMMVAWKTLGIVAVPFLHTPYPGSDIYYRNKEKILNAYGGDLELFVRTLNDATEPVVSISRNFTLTDLLILRFHMVRQDREAIDAYENAWRKRNNLPDRSDWDQWNEWGLLEDEIASVPAPTPTAV